MDCSTPGFPVHHQLLELFKLMSTESVMPSNHRILCHSLLLPSIFPSIRIFSSESVLYIRWPKYWSFSFSISPFNEYSEYLVRSVQFSSVTQSCPTLCDPMDLQHARPPCPSPTPGACSNSCLLSQWCHPTISFSVVPFSSCLQSFPESGSFHEKTRFSLLPMNV